MSNNNNPTYQEELKELRKNLTGMLSKKSLEVFDNDANLLDSSIQNILKVNQGDKAPDFTLSNAIGESINLYQELKKSKIILVFYRGTWCPYCNLALSHYQSHLLQFKDLGASLIAISAQTPDESLTISEKNNLDFEVLSDNGNLVANLYTHVFKNGDKPLSEMENLGFNFDSFYDNDSKEIPVPAIFIIEQNGEVSFAKSEGGDYRNRTESSELITHLNK